MDSEFVRQLKVAVPRYLRRCDANSTQAAYKRELRRFCSWWDGEWRRDVLLDYRDHLRARGLSPTTVRWRLTVVRAFLRYAAAGGLDIVEGMVTARLPSGQTGFAPRILTRIELRDLLLAPDRRTRRGRRDALVLAFLGVGGLRAGEVCRLGIGDVETRPARTVLRVDGKSRKQRLVPLPGLYDREIRAYLASWPEALELRAPLFWCGPEGHETKRLTVAAIDYLLRRACEKAGVQRINAHGLRHTAASHAVDAGEPLHRLRDRMGHSSVIVTSKYLHVQD